MKRGLLPFSVNRNEPTRLFEQIYKGMRDAIVCGFYREGDILPARSAIAAYLGVSEVVVRKALGMLISEKLLTSRPRIGCMVLKPRGMHMFAKVLIVNAERAGGYPMGVKTEMIEKELFSAGYCPCSIWLDNDARGRIDCSDFRRALDSNPDFVVIQSCPMHQRGLVRLAERYGRPYIVIGSLVHNSCRNIFSTRDCNCAGALRAFVDACRTERIRSVCQMGFGQDSFMDAKRLLEGVGIYVERVDVDIALTLGSLEKIQRDGSVAMQRRLRAGPLPDLLFFVDDYLTLGAMPALLERGVRIPEDVKVVTFANKGFGPVFTKSFTRIEMDMRKAGQALGKSLVAWLGSGVFPDPSADFVATYIPGETFPCTSYAKQRWNLGASVGGA